MFHFHSRSFHLFSVVVADVSAKSLRTPSNVFVINLAFCDFLMMSKTPIFIYNSFSLGYALGSTGCQIFSLVGALSGIGAAITNAYIAYDRLHFYNSTNINIYMYTTYKMDLDKMRAVGKRKRKRKRKKQRKRRIYAKSAFLSISRYHVIANPLEGKLTMTKAVFIVILIWCYAIPWSLFPYFKVWGRFVPGR